MRNTYKVSCKISSVTALKKTVTNLVKAHTEVRANTKVLNTSKDQEIYLISLEAHPDRLDAWVNAAIQF